MALILWRFELTCVQHEASKTAAPSTFCNLLLFSHKTTDPVSRWSCWHPPLGSGRSSFLDQFIPLGVSGRGIQLHLKAGYIPGLVTSSLQCLGVRYLAQGYLGAPSMTCCISCLNWGPSTSTGSYHEGDVRWAFDPFHTCPAWMPCTHHNVWIEIAPISE